MTQATKSATREFVEGMLEFWLVVTVIIGVVVIGLVPLWIFIALVTWVSHQ